MTATAQCVALPGEDSTQTTKYQGCTVVFGTHHGKEGQVSKPFLDILGAHVIAPPSLDTDQFGTFSGEIRRLLSPLEASRAKTRLAIAETGHPWALASEGSYGVLPGIGWPGHEEILVFVDDTRGIEIVEGHRSLGIPGTVLSLTSHSEIGDDLARAGWPAQAVIVRPEIPSDGKETGITKGIVDSAALASAIAKAVHISSNGRAVIEPDLRAHHSPSRRAILRQLGVTMATRLARACPGCESPGWGKTGVSAGLPCSACGLPTDQTRADIWSCVACLHEEPLLRQEETAEPRSCAHCNP